MKHFDYIFLLGCFFFFFSSRRRHTRWNCDWSSDVCSSDLMAVRCLLIIDGERKILVDDGIGTRWDGKHREMYGIDHKRSEERRVGKECRSRWSPQHEKKKKRDR